MSLLVGPTSMLAAFLPPTPLQLQYHHRLQPQPQANAPSSHHPPVAGKPSPLLRLHAAGSAHKGAEDDGGAGRQQQHYTRRRRQSSEGVFLGNLTRLELMGWDVLEPEEEGYKRLGLTVPDLKAEDFQDLKVNLRFGFEGGLSSATGLPGATERKRKQPPIMVEFETPYALCYPPGTRARGCQELITPALLEEAGITAGAGGGAVGLPCTVSGTCPFVTFSCERGHTWRAEPGTPACFYCPRCRERTKNVRGFTATGLDNSLPLPTLRGRRRVLDPAARLRKTVGERQGRVLGAYAGAKAKTRLRCGSGHEWEARPENVLRGSWCPVCAKEARSSGRALTLDDMRALAEEAGGSGATCVPGQEYRGTAKSLTWACAGASGVVHEFSRTPNYVRKGIAVGRAFCVECERLLSSKTRAARGGEGQGPPAKLAEDERRRGRAPKKQQQQQQE